MKKPLVSSIVFILALCGAWQISKQEKVEHRSLSSHSPVRINNCEIQVNEALKANAEIKNLVEKTWEEKVVKLSAICKKWTEGSEVFYIALYAARNNQDQDTAFLALFQEGVTVRSRPVWVFESLESPSLLGNDVFTVVNNGDEEVLALADLNQDQRPEIILAISNGPNASLFGFQLDNRKKQLVPLVLTTKDENTTFRDTSVIISAQNNPVAHIERNGVASSIRTKDSTLTAEKDQWIKVENK